jgi:putative endonuclease
MRQLRKTELSNLSRNPVPLPTFARLQCERATVGGPTFSLFLRGSSTQRAHPPTGEGCPPWRVARRWNAPTTTVVNSATATNRARCTFMQQRFVYVLKNSEVPPRYYTGVTCDVAARLGEHNAGKCAHTGKYRPWSVDVVVEFGDERRALAFERYLKSGSGVAFAHRHLR